MWEHAYAMKYKAARTEYVTNMFKVANWRQVETYFNNAKHNS